MSASQSAITAAEPMTVVFFGIQGSGKGTQTGLLGKLLQERDPARPALVLGMGNMMRAYLAEHDTELTRRIRPVMEQGELLPSFVPSFVLNHYLADQLTASHHLLLEGVGRRPFQAELLDETLVFYGRGNFQMVLLELSIETARQRLEKRGRADDTDNKSLERRFELFKEQLLPSMELLAEKGHPLHRIDGEAHVDEVHAGVLKALGLDRAAQ